MLDLAKIETGCLSFFLGGIIGFFLTFMVTLIVPAPAPGTSPDIVSIILMLPSIPGMLVFYLLDQPMEAHFLWCFSGGVGYGFLTVIGVWVYGYCRKLYKEKVLEPSKPDPAN